MNEWMNEWIDYRDILFHWDWAAISMLAACFSAAQA
jgi:hypothetical protein